jgi:rod shape-determining protein MreD
MNPAHVLASLMPVSLAFLAVIVVNLPVSVTFGLLPPPVLALAPIYYWVLVRPDLMPPVAVLMIGLLEDLLSGGPPGLWAAGCLAAYALADRERDVFAGLSGPGAILGFASAAFAAAGAVYLLGSLVYWRLAPLGPLLLQSVVTVIFYPLIAILMAWLQRKYVGAFRGT